MALFKAEDLLRVEDTEKTFDIVGFKTGDDAKPSTLTIKVNKDIRAVARRAKTLYNNVKMTAKKGKTEIKPVDDPLAYCTEIIKKAYISSAGDIVDVHSQEVFLALLERIPSFARYMAGEMIDFFDSDDKFQAQEEEEDRKN